MKVTEFIENRYQELRMKQEENIDQFDVWIDSEMKAAHAWLGFYRIIAKWLMMPKILFHYLEVNLGAVSAPEPVLLNRFKKQKEEADKKKSEDQNKLSELQGSGTEESSGPLVQTT